MTSQYDNYGRINKDAVIISTSTLFGIVVLAVAARAAFQFRARKPTGWDDAFLLFGLLSLVTSFAIMHIKILPNTYLVGAVSDRGAKVIPPGNIVQIAWDYHKWIAIELSLCWVTIMAAKFSFLFFFKKLIGRLRGLTIYWWAITVFNVAVAGYGTSVYYLACPYFYSVKAFECGAGAAKNKLVTHASVQMSLDVIGDFLILAMPITIVWKIKIYWTQKIALVLSLSVTIFMIAITIVRVSGLVYRDAVDTIWEFYWHVVSANVAIFMASAIAFRSFFVARNSNRPNLSPQDQARRFFQESFMRKFGPKDPYSFGDTTTAASALPSVPRAQLSGIRTFIGRQGRSANDTLVAEDSVELTTLVGEQDTARNNNAVSNDSIHTYRAYSA